MDTRQLAAFCAVVERRSFSQAAERLGVTQPAVSLQVRALEKRLGMRLLDRSGRRVEPTEAGWQLYRGAQRMLVLEDDLGGNLASDDAADQALGHRLPVDYILIAPPGQGTYDPRRPGPLGVENGLQRVQPTPAK